LQTSRRPSRHPAVRWLNLACFVGLAVVSLTLLTWKAKDRLPIGVLESAVFTAARPLQQGITWTTHTVKGVWSNYLNLIDVRQENTRLQEEVKWLREENHRSLEAYLQFQRLQQLLNFKDRLPPETTVAAVVGRDASNWTEIIYIDKGTRDRMSKGLPVVTHEGLVGQIIHAAPALSQVMLVTDFRSGVDALVQRTRASGIVSGRGRNVAELKFLPVGADVQPGDRLISSGMGRVFPKGLIIGAVKSIHRNGGQFQAVEVQPSIDASHLEEVLVLLNP
jgi:rod shape-determining protein MreC